MSIKIALGCDHPAFSLKETIKQHLINRGFTVCDFGTFSEDKVDYPDFAIKAANAVKSKQCQFGILICGTGIGISIAANKVKGIRAALCTSEFMARATREHNDANMLALGARVTGEGAALCMVDAFLDTPYTHDPRHQKRIDKITAIENGELVE